MAPVGSVVPREADEGVVFYAVLLELGQQLAHCIVNGYDGAFIGGSPCRRNPVAVTLGRALRSSERQRARRGKGLACPELVVRGISVDEFGHVVAVEIGQVGIAAILFSRSY